VTVTGWPRTVESYSVMLVTSLILGESVFACHGRRLTGGQQVSVDAPGVVSVDSASPSCAVPRDQADRCQCETCCFSLARPRGVGQTRVM
jgi:hypothetical protein